MSATQSTSVVAEAKQEGFRVYVGNLPYSATEEKVREHIASAGGEISSIVLPLKFGSRPSGFAFAQYDKEEDAKNAVEKLNDSDFDGRNLRVQIARPEEDREERNAKRKTARKAKIAEKKAATAEAGDEAPAPAAAAATTEDGDKPKKPRKKKAARTTRRRQPAEEGEESEGAEVAEVKAGETTKPKRAPKETARIDGSGTEGAEKPKRERKSREKKMAPSGEASKDTLFVSNLPYELDDDALSSIFTNLSISVKSATVLRSTFRTRREKEGKEEPADVKRRSRGFGFVVVENPAQLNEAVEKASGTLIANRTINVKVANEMQPIEKAEAADAGVKVDETADKPAA